MKKSLIITLVCFLVCVKCSKHEFRFVRNPTNNEEIRQNSRSKASSTFKLGRTGGDKNDVSGEILIDNNGGTKDGNTAKDDNTAEDGNTAEDVGKALLLTPYIEEGRFEEARNLSSVSADIFFTYDSYSGFLTVDKDKSSHLFFWYFPITNDAIVADSPWIVWLQGGPGSSSMDGMFNEIGPIRVVNGVLELNPYSWHRNHSLVFIDNPVGAGFSYTDDIDGYTSHMHTYSGPLYNALKQLVQLFPELKTAPLFVAGESYAGKYVPGLAMEIHKHEPDNDINLQGLMIGNGLTEPSIIKNSFKNFLTFGLIEKEQWNILEPIRVALLNDLDANKSFECSRKYNQLVYYYHQMAGMVNDFNFLANTLELGNYQTFINQSHIRRAIHVGGIKFTNFNETVYDKVMAVDFLSSSRENLETLLDHYRVLLYCGQLDLVVPCETTAEIIREYKWKKSGEFLNASRDQWMYGENLAGYHKSGGGLTWMVVRGAGHFVPLDKSAEAQEMIALWTHSRPIPTQSGPSIQELTQIVAEYSVDQAEAEKIEDPVNNATDDDVSNATDATPNDSK